MNTRDELMDLLVAVGANGGLTYLSVPITSGRRHFEYLAHHPVRPIDRVRWYKEVKQPNIDSAAALATRLREALPGTVVLNPAAFEKPLWSQDDYNGFWLEVINRFAKSVVASPGWEWSKGARLEVGAALFHGKEIVRIDGTAVGQHELEIEAERARERLADEGWTCDSIDRDLPALTVDHPVLPPSAPAETFGWLIAERRYQVQKFGLDLDDAHTLEGLGPDGWWRRQLDNYLHRSFVLGLDLPVGRQAIAKYVATAVGLLESVIRTKGALPPPGVPSGELDG